MSIPIIFTHTNNSLYLQLALLQAKKSCKENVCLIGDQSNAASFVRHFMLSDYDKSELCADFEKNYKHFSPNPYNYELFCLKRWFVALDFLQKNNLAARMSALTWSQKQLKVIIGQSNANATRLTKRLTSPL